MRMVRSNPSVNTIDNADTYTVIHDDARADAIAIASDNAKADAIAYVFAQTDVNAAEIPDSWDGEEEV